MKASDVASLDPIAEVQLVRLGDSRLDRRAVMLARALKKAPAQSLPVATGGGAALEGAYRFLSNRRVTMAKLLAPHIEATVARMRCASTVIVAHDTTELRFGGESERDGLGDVTGIGQGFFAHVALAITDERHPLGVLGVEVVTRERGRIRNTPAVDYLDRTTDREGNRWRALIEEVQALAGDALPIHVMDREAEEFTLLADMVEMGCRFVARMSESRKRRALRVDGVDAKKVLVADAVHGLRGVLEREVILSSRSSQRGANSRRVHVSRDRRMARLSFSAATMTIAPPRQARRSTAPLNVNVVHVLEVDAPEGESPVEWVLYSNEPILTPADVLAIVDAYRARWVIEEFFKVVKTGCAIEQRQLESRDALLNCLGLLMPIAVKMLALRTYARAAPATPASVILSPPELAALRLVSQRRLSPAPTADEVLRAIAALGGHLPNNGFPGWITIARGFATLQIATQVYEATQGSDQS